MKKVFALTHHCTGLENCIKTPAVVQDDSGGKSVDTAGIWDTGATNSCITHDLAQKLGLKPVSMAKVLGVHGVQTVNVYAVKITLNNQNITVDCLVTEAVQLSDSNDTGLLIGMNVICLGDFCITNYKGKTAMTFRVPSLETVDYVSEISENNRINKIYSIQSKKGIEKCPCGSGKIFKNCHGKSVYNK